LYTKCGLFFKVLLAKMVRLGKKIISAKYYLCTTILTTVTRTVKIEMFEHVCDYTVFTVIITKMKQEPFLISNKDLSAVEKSNIKYIVLFRGPMNSQLCSAKTGSRTSRWQWSPFLLSAAIDILCTDCSCHQT